MKILLALAIVTSCTFGLETALADEEIISLNTAFMLDANVPNFSPRIMKREDGEFIMADSSTDICCEYKIGIVVYHKKITKHECDKIVGTKANDSNCE